MFVLYCMGIAATGLALVGAIFGVFSTGRLSAIVNLMLTFVSLNNRKTPRKCANVASSLHLSLLVLHLQLRRSSLLRL